MVAWALTCHLRVMRGFGLFYGFPPSRLRLFVAYHVEYLKEFLNEAS